MASNAKLEVLGITDEGQVVFSFNDATSGISTSFGISLKKYFGQNWSTDEMSFLSKYLKECKDCLSEDLRPEGTYMFIPD